MITRRVSIRGEPFDCPEAVLFTEGGVKVVVDDDLVMRPFFESECRHCGRSVQMIYAYGERTGGHCDCGYWSEGLDWIEEGDAVYRWNYRAWDESSRRQRYEKEAADLRARYGIMDEVVANP